MAFQAEQLMRHVQVTLGRMTCHVVCSKIIRIGPATVCHFEVQCSRFVCFQVVIKAEGRTEEEILRFSPVRHSTIAPYDGMTGTEP